MTREELIKSDEWIEATTEVLIRTGRRIKQMRKDMDEFIKEYRDELISLNSTKTTIKTNKNENRYTGRK